MRRRFSRFYALLFLLFLYTGSQLARLLPGVAAWSLAAAIIVVMVAWQFGFRSGALPAASRRLVVLAWTGNLVMGAWATFVLLSLPANLIQGLILFGRYVFSLGPLSPAAADFWSRQLPEGTLAVSLAIAVIGLLQVLWGPRVKRVRVPLRDLPAELEGVTLAQISDLHVGPTIRRSYIAKVVAKVMTLKPDLIALTGDFGDGPAEQLAPHWGPLADLKAPLGKFYVTGNHEYYWGVDGWVEAARRSGFTPLMNENRLVSHRGKELLVAGVTDVASEHFPPSPKSDPAKAMNGANASALKLLLAHRPESCIEAEKAGFDLQLSGHTHSGQFFPFIFFMPFTHQYYRGLNRHESMWVYVNAGTGYWGPPNRFAIPSEITLLTLTRA